MTEQVKHTPGPWMVDDEGDVMFADGTIAWVGSALQFDDPYLPNAHLIAAAPDMYEALKAVIESPDIICTSAAIHKCGLHEARAAIAKAEGR